MSRSEPSHPDCVFCKIVNGAIASSVVLETVDVVAILDIHPVNQGHVLLIPKSHHSDLTELPEALAAKVGAILPRLCRAVLSASGAEGFHLIVNNGECAGQTVSHGHWHIIPRRRGDAVHWPWPHIEYLGDELGRMKLAIEGALKSDAPG